MKLKISVAQMKIIRSDPEANLQKAEPLIARAAERGSHLICFPEMWTTGFEGKVHKRMSFTWDKTIAAVSILAREYGIWISGSMPALNKEGNPANTLILFDSSGEQVAVYQKSHLFSLLSEDQYMAPGDSLTVVDTPWGLMGLSICYDLRFPELFRTYALKGVKLVLLPAAFPYPRLAHWKVLTRARAIENQLFMVGTNRIGDEEFETEGKITYFGNSCVIDPWGEALVEASENREELLGTEIDMGQVDEVRSRMTVLKDRRPELYELG